MNKYESQFRYSWANVYNTLINIYMLIPILFKDNNVSYVTLIQQVSQ